MTAGCDVLALRGRRRRLGVAAGRGQPLFRSSQVAAPKEQAAILLLGDPLRRTGEEPGVRLSPAQVRIECRGELRERAVKMSVVGKEDPVQIAN